MASGDIVQVKEVATSLDAAFDLRGNPSAIEAITRAEVDIQISTAKRYPRNISKFMQDAKAMIELSPELAAACTYVLPARKDGDDPITGPSVRLAEIVACCWGNLRVIGRITDDDGKFLTAQGVAADLEKNVAYLIETRVGVTYSPKAKWNPGSRFGDDMVKIRANAAIAIATRNAEFKVIPRAFVDLLQEHAAEVARGDVQSLPRRVIKALDWLGRKGIAEARVFDALGVRARDEFTADHLLTLRGWITAADEGDASLESYFAPSPPQSPAQAPLAEHSPGDKKTKSSRVAQSLLGAETREPGSEG